MKIRNQQIATSQKKIRTYADLLQQIHDDLRIQHPEWVEPNGESPMCDFYEARLMELLRERIKLKLRKQYEAHPTRGGSPNGSASKMRLTPLLSLHGRTRKRASVSAIFLRWPFTTL